MTKSVGYYLFPTIHDDRIAFVCEGDIWSASLDGGIARRLTSCEGSCSYPRFSPDGKHLAFVAREQGEPEVYLMDSQGGPIRRMTFMGSAICSVQGWSSDGLRIVFASDAQAFDVYYELFEIDLNGGMPRPLKLGQAVSIAAAKDGAIVIGRNASDSARWKRYRGGMAGELWIDQKGRGNFSKLLHLEGFMSSPMWIGGRVYFSSDHEGIANIYSCKPDGNDVRRHTHHDEYFVRFPTTDGQRIVYTAGGDLYVLDCAEDRVSKIDVQVPAAPRQSVRKFVDGVRNIDHVSVHPQSMGVGVISRGQPFTMPFWDEAAVQHGVGSSVRYRCLEWLYEGKEFVVANDQSGYERLELHSQDQSTKPQFITDKDVLGRVVDMKTSPVANHVAVTNHKNELLLVDVAKKKISVLDRSPAEPIHGIDWSPDGRWIAYDYAPVPGVRIIRVYDTHDDKAHDVTEPMFYDFAPAWDPDGNYLYFLSRRDLNPVYDGVVFDLGFPLSVRPYLAVLRSDVKNPFVAAPRPLVELPGAAAAPAQTAVQAASTAKGQKTGKKTAKSGKAKKSAPAQTSAPAAVAQAPAGPKPVVIELDELSKRIIAFPVEAGHYSQIAGVSGRAIFLKLPLTPIKRGGGFFHEPPAGDVWAYDYREQRAAVYIAGVRYFHLGLDRRTLVYHANGNRWRAVDALGALLDSPAAPQGDQPGRRSGYLDMQRVQVLIDPQQEWKQMFDECWRLQRDHFWTANMSDVDWDAVYDRYARLLPRINSRVELSDLIWEMQGELGTSHAYEFGGDHRHPPYYNRGFLGAELSYHEDTGGYKIARILRGDSWDPEADSPLGQPGLGVKEGDVITAVGGRAVSKTCSVDELLTNCYGKDVLLTVCDGDGKNSRRISIKALRHEKFLRYRLWVETNRRYVHKKTGGKVGYIHIPDMQAGGFAEFHRSFMSEVHKEGLVVDVRHNHGGHVSQLLLEKLRRTRVGYDISRWGMPQPYPLDSPTGTMVGITNQFAGSDGDIFSHCFKLYKLGPMVGKRTWGGVIGIWPRHHLVDGTITTQPEFSFWFVDEGWGVENYGTDPDYDVDIAPQDARLGKDPQMDKAVELILDMMKKKPFKLPKFDKRPSLPLPRLKKTVAATKRT